jgi:hypothetical protein
MKLEEVTKFPVKVTLDKRNPWGESIKVNNILIQVTKETIINSKTELKLLTPIAKYAIFTVIEEAVKLPKSKKAK